MDDGWLLAVSRTIFQVDLHSVEELGLRQHLAALVDIRRSCWPLSCGWLAVVVFHEERDCVAIRDHIHIDIHMDNGAVIPSDTTW